MSFTPGPSARNRHHAVRRVLTGAAAVGAVAGSVGLGTAAPAHAAATYYLVIGGTCDGTSQGLSRELPVGNKILVNYPANAPGDFACTQALTPSYTDSVNIGHTNAKSTLEAAYRRDPGGHYVVVGYSQGAQVANLLLNDIADGRSIPAGQVSAKLYGDPMTPGTGIGAVIPKGWGVPFGGYISPGAGRTNFGPISFVRYCITDDGVCDDRNPFTAVGGYFAQHFCYGSGKLFERVGNGLYTNQTQYWAKQNCHSPIPGL